MSSLNEQKSGMYNHPLPRERGCDVSRIQWFIEYNKGKRAGDKKPSF